MNTTYVIAQLVVTLALLGYAWLFRTLNPSLSSLVVGAVIAHWLNQSQKIGQNVAANTEIRKVEAEARLAEATGPGTGGNGGSSGSSGNVGTGSVTY